MTLFRGRSSAARWILDVVIVVLLGCAVAAGLLSRRSSGRPPVAETTTVAPSTPETETSAGVPRNPATRLPSPTPSGVPDRLRRSAPVDLRIPAIGVHTRLVPLGIEPDGALQVPTDFAVAGWYTRGPTPGEVGPAVIAGHIDSYRGPAVFFRLSALRPGDVVRVAEHNGLVAQFRVYAIGQYSKAAFPADRVYGNTDSPELRLITCGGSFDTHSLSYRDNVVVYARLVGATSRP